MPPAHTNPFGDLPEQRIAPKDEIVQAELAAPEPADSGERLSILYLMVWTAGSAVILAFYRQSITQSLNEPNRAMDPTWLQTAAALLMSPLQGAGVAAVALMVWRKLRGGRPFPKHPGHWLLVIAGLLALVTWPAWLITREFIRGGPPGLYLITYRLPIMVVFIALCCFAVAKMPSEVLWRKMFLIWIFGNSVPIFFLCVMYVDFSSYRWARLPDMFIGAALPIAFLVTGVLDRASGVPRDHLHWAGIGCRVAYVGLVVLEIVRFCLPTP
jgi:hypothetical protein